MPAVAPERSPAPADAFGEALGVVSIVHTPAANGQRALAIGDAALPLLRAAAHYPFAELMAADAPGAAPLLKADRRVRGTRLSDLPPEWKADVIGVAVPGLPDDVLAAAKRHAAPHAVVVVAVDRYAAGPVAKRLTERHWRTVVPYREFLPEPQLFLLASDSRIERRRPVPGWTRRISEGYLPALFRFPKDEYAALFTSAPRMSA